MGATTGNWFLSRICFIAFISALLGACNDVPTYAPVYEIANIEPLISHYAKPTKTIAPQPVTKVKNWYPPVSLQYQHTIKSVNKGVDIIGRRGEPVFATQAGKVVYSGSELRGYGNLIIIKHNNDYLSVYAHCDDVAIKSGDWVNRGQIIAKMGDSGTNLIKLHFEIRRLGKPLNPLILVSLKSV